MRSTPLHVLAPAAALLAIMVSVAAAQTPAKTAPSASEWAALAKLPDFTGGWGVGGGRGRWWPRGPALPPAAAAKRKELQSLAREDNQTANCLPPGMPGIMN